MSPTSVLGSQQGGARGAQGLSPACHVELAPVPSVQASLCKPEHCLNGPPCRRVPAAPMLLRGRRPGTDPHWQAVATSLTRLTRDAAASGLTCTAHWLLQAPHLPRHLRRVPACP